MFRLVRPPLAAALFAFCAEAEVHDIILTGVCDDKKELNGARFNHQGETASGTPYYKAEGHAHFLFHDPDCSGGGDGTPRWILSDKAPDAGRTADLDNDGTCEYWARVNSAEPTPPLATTWHMKCGGSWENRFLALVQAPATTSGAPAPQPATTLAATTQPATMEPATTQPAATQPATTEEGHSAEIETTPQTVTMTQTTTVTMAPTTTVTETHTTTTYLPRRIGVFGACEYKDYLNGMEFVYDGLTKEGAPFYKGHGLAEDQYIYHDADCFGTGSATPRWVIDDTRPLLNRSSDLDADGQCRYHARVDSTDLFQPPENATWTMFCGGAGWEERQLEMRYLDRVTPTPAPTTEAATTAAPTPAPATLAYRLNGACDKLGFLNDMVLRDQGHTADGAHFFKGYADGRDIYMYHDAHCDGNSSTDARWILDVDAPSVSQPSDLDADGQCDYYARAADSGNSSSTPALSSVWRMYCDGVWENALLIFTEIAGVQMEEEDDAVDVGSPQPSAEPHGAPATISMEGACEALGFANGMALSKKGVTANDAPFYQGYAENVPFYLYQDPACDGVASRPRWILDETAPNVTRAADLDGDGQCDYFARLITNETSGVPESATWHMNCGAEWRDLQLTFTPEAGDDQNGHDSSHDAVVTASASGWRLPLVPILAFAIALREVSQ